MTRTSRLLIAAAVTVGFALPAAAQNVKADQGAAVFAAQKCTLCHSVNGKGNPKGSLDHITAKNKAEHIRQWITDPEGMRTKTNSTRTPAMKPVKLTADQIDALVAYIMSAKADRAADDAGR